MSRKLHYLYHAQDGICFYCARPTWMTGMPRLVAKAFVGLEPRADRKAMRRRQATLEHLKRKADGGTRELSNLVMACVDCNTRRQGTPVLLHLAAMRAGAEPTAPYREKECG